MSRTEYRVQKAAFALWLICASTGLGLGAQEIDAVHGKAGTFVIGMDEKLGRSELASTERAKALAVAQPIVDILRRNPAIGTPRGFSVRLQRAYGKRTDWADYDSSLPFFAGVYGTFFAPEEHPSPTHFGNPDFGIYINTILQCPLSEFTFPGDHDGPWKVNGTLPVLEGGRHTGQIHGHDVYDGQCIVMTRSKQPPFLPLTQAQYLQLEIGSFQSRLKEANERAKDPSMPLQVHDALVSAARQIGDLIHQWQSELQSMDAAARAVPAAVTTGQDEAVLASPDDPEAIPLSVPNPDFFDRSLPGTRVQSVAVYLPYAQPRARAAGLPSGLSEDWIPAMQKILDGMDWGSLEGLLAQ